MWLIGGMGVRQTGSTYTETGWEVHPPALTGVLQWFKDRYGNIPLYITENGAAFYDPPKAGPNGVNDPLRVQYLRDHIAAIGDAITAGVNVRGYMLWSLLDNLEWSLGYTKRFGIVHVDFQTQVRTPKDSAWIYRDIIAANGKISERSVSNPPSEPVSKPQLESGIMVDLQRGQV